MKRIILFFRTVLLSTVFFISVWVWMVSVYQGSEFSLMFSHQSENGLLTVLHYPSFYDDFCGNFTRSVTSDLYKNYTLNSNLLSHIHTRVKFPHRPTRFHFAVNSSPRNFKARRTIRRTWKKLFQNNSSCSAIATFAFYVGKTSDKGVATWLEREFRDHPDDMVLIDFCDAYENLPLKTYNIMRFVDGHVPAVDFVVKIDDDVLPNVHLLSRCFGEIQDPRYGLYGWVTIDKVPEAGGKYQLVPGRYANSTLPPFTHGPTYVVRRSDLPKLLDAAQRIPLLNLEDVWFTGLVADAAGVQRKNATQFLQMYRKAKEFDEVHKAMKRAFFFHRVSETTVSRVWAKYPQNCSATNDLSFCDDFGHVTKLLKVKRIQ